MADVKPNGEAVIENPAEGEVDVAEQLHLHGKGHSPLDDAVEHDLSPDSQEAQREELFSHANVQSGRRQTLESILADQAAVGSTLANPSTIVGDDYRPTETDHVVEAEFDAVQPGTAQPAADQREEDEEEEEDDLPRTEDMVRTLDVLPPTLGDDDWTGMTAAAGQPLPSLEVPEPPPGDAPLPEDEDGQPPVAQTPTLLVSDASGLEDEPIRLDIRASLNDSDRGRETLSVTLRDVPEGFSFSDETGRAVGVQVAPGVWTFTAQELTNLYLVRPEHHSGEHVFLVEAISREANGSTAIISAKMEVFIEAVADAPTLAVDDAAGVENEWIALEIDSALVDTDGSESLLV
ncbi:hypothetical protein, partial [Telmatospirillum sp. J64-1]|uniref:hypothetical protein n=1 Tax=Telmatospirillum sp. J64-1 TaxID=2502183 RepID=UPI00115F0D56